MISNQLERFIKSPQILQKRLGIAEKIEDENSTKNLAARLLSLGESSFKIANLRSLKTARSVIFNFALLEGGVTQNEEVALRDWLNAFEKKLETYLRSQNTSSSRPLLEDDRLSYFLWVATSGGFGHGEAVQVLLPFCYESLLRSVAREEKDGRRTSIADDMPHQLAVFIRFFPRDRLLNKYTVKSSVGSRDVAAALEAYRKTDAGPSEMETIERYRRQICNILRIEEVSQPKNDSLTFSSELRRDLGFPADAELKIEELSEEFSGSNGLIVWAEQEDDIEHPYENARRVLFGSWGNPNSALRAAHRWTTHDVRVLLSAEIYRLVQQLDKFIEQADVRKLPLLVWTVLVTGLPLKRVLNMRFAGENSRWEELLEKADGEEESPLFILPKLGVLLAAPTADLGFSRKSCRSTAYREQAEFIPLFLGKRGIDYALAAAAASAPGNIKNLKGKFVFPAVKNPARALSEDSIHNLLAAVSERGNVAANNLALTWARIRATSRPYCAKASVNPLVFALSSGRPTHAAKTTLHYVAKDAEKFFCLQARVVQAIEAVADERKPQAFLMDVYRKILPKFIDVPILSELIGKSLGAAYAPREFLVKRAWRALCAAEGESAAAARRDSGFGKLSNLTTLRAIFFLMATTGIRQQELAAITRNQVDLTAGLLRLEGKKSAHLRESREVPLCGKSIEELRRYQKSLMEIIRSSKSVLPTDGNAFFLIFDADGSLRPLPKEGVDWLVKEVNLSGEILFSLQTLRHALRTALDEIETEFAAVNEIFGHVTIEQTETHRLSGSRFVALEKSFLTGVETVLPKLLGIN